MAVAVRVLLAALLGLYWSSSRVEGVTFSLKGNSIPNNGSRVLITDINPDGDNDEDDLICRSETTISRLSGIGDWYLHPTRVSTSPDDRITGQLPDRGWLSILALDSESHRLVRLRRASDTAEEGVFTCDIPGDIGTFASVIIYYASEPTSSTEPPMTSSTEPTTELPPAAPSGLMVDGVNDTSVTVSWQTVDGADRYTVTFTNTLGNSQQGLCISSTDIEIAHVSVDAPSTSAGIGVGQILASVDTTMLRAYTTYSITVVAESDVAGSSENSVAITVTTAQTNAAVAPRSVTTTVVSSTVISVQWDGLDPCRHVNGLIVLYRVQYTEVASGVVQSKDEAGEWNVMNAETSLTGLTPSTSYSIQIAAVNEEGDVGLYSHPLTRQTLPAQLSVTVGTTTATSISLSWTSAGSEVDSYEVMWTSGECPDGVDEGSATITETSYIIEDLREGIVQTTSVYLSLNDDIIPNHGNTAAIIGGSVVAVILTLTIAVVTIIFVLKKTRGNVNKQKENEVDLSMSTHKHGSLTTATNPAYEMMKQGEGGEGGGRGGGGGGGRGGGEGGVEGVGGKGGQGSHEYELVDVSPGTGPPIAMAADKMYEMPSPPFHQPLPAIPLSVAPATGGVAKEGEEEGVYDNIPGNQ